LKPIVLAFVLCAGSVFGQNAQAPRPKTALHTATGIVIAVDRERRKVTLDAAPVEDLKLPALALALLVSNRAILDKIRVGQRVKVEFIEQGRNFALTRIAPAPAPAATPGGHESWGY
jgi:Cu/Ag efflux protein CusF